MDKQQKDVKGLSDEELKAELKERLCTELSDSKFEALFVSTKVIDKAIKDIDYKKEGNNHIFTPVFPEMDIESIEKGNIHEDRTSILDINT